MVPMAMRQQLTSAVAKDGSENAADRIIFAAISAAGAVSEINTAAYESSRWPNAVKSLFGFK